MTDTTMSASKICTSCGQRKPIEEFRRRHRGNDAVRHVWCRPCYLEYQRLQRVAHKDRKTQHAIYEAARRDRDDATITALIRETMIQVGGVEAFANILKAKVKSTVKRTLKRNEAKIPLIIPVVIEV